MILHNTFHLTFQFIWIINTSTAQYAEILHRNLFHTDMKFCVVITVDTSNLFSSFAILYTVTPHLQGQVTLELIYAAFDTWVPSSNLLLHFLYVKHLLGGWQVLHLIFETLQNNLTLVLNVCDLIRQVILGFLQNVYQMLTQQKKYYLTWLEKFNPLVQQLQNYGLKKFFTWAYFCPISWRKYNHQSNNTRNTDSAKLLFQWIFVHYSKKCKNIFYEQIAVHPSKLLWPGLKTKSKLQKRTMLMLMQYESTYIETTGQNTHVYINNNDTYRVFIEQCFGGGYIIGNIKVALSIV